MNHKHSIRGLIFDFDNTLVNSDIAYAYALERVGIDPDGPHYQAAREAVKCSFVASSTQQHHRLLYFKQLAKMISPRDILNLMEAYEGHLTSHISQQWQKLARTQLLTALRSSYKVAVITNENARTQLIKWAACDPEGALFDVFITSEEVGVEKPHAAVLSAALDALQLTHENCIVVGDSYAEDIKPAIKRGMTAWQNVEFLPLNAPKHPDPTMRLSGLEKLRSLLL